jgi:hypothetical protein
MTSCITGPVLQSLETVQPKIENASPAAVPSARPPKVPTPPALRKAPRTEKRDSMSLRRLAPLVIPTKERGRSPLNNLLDDDHPPEVPPKSPRMSSPNQKASGSVAQVNTCSTPLVNSATSTTPPSPWEGRSSPNPLTTPLRCDSPAQGRSRTLTRDVESSTPILDRGRPTRRAGGETRNINHRTRSGKTSQAEAHKASEHLPKGYRADDAVRKFSNSHITLLQREATRHTEKFEVLAYKDVERLSKVCALF